MHERYLLLGVDTSLYGSYDGADSYSRSDVSSLNPTGNIAALSNYSNLFSSCSFSAWSSYCATGTSLRLQATSSGEVVAVYNTGGGGINRCSVDTSSSSCEVNGSGGGVIG